MKIAILVLPLLLSSAGAEAAISCRAVGGHINGQPPGAAVTRVVSIAGNRMTLSGKIGARAMPRRQLACAPIAKGVFCEATFSGASVTVMTNGARMVETVTNPFTGEELAGTYACGAAIKIGR